MEEQLRLTPTEFKRYKYRELPWEARLVGLMGPRGVGKSTMVLQHIKEQDEETRRRSIYVSADHTYAGGNSRPFCARRRRVDVYRRGA